MAQKLSIIHISDLHRITADNVDCLLASFEVEKEYYRANGIAQPSFVVVSGDIINGSNEKDAIKAQKEIKEQYQVAGKFLVGLSEVFFEGARGRVIIVPGNHDMSRYVSISSMTKIDADDLSPFVKALWEDNSNIRWSWKDLSFYDITDKAVYNARFQDFIDFYDNFYQQGGLNRSFPKDSVRQSFMLDYKDENVTFACFNSCYHLDHLQSSGYISPNSLSFLSRELLEKKRQGRLIIAVWHHHTQGLPKENNYLNYHILDNMSKYGIRLALHGHQHISGILNEYRDIFTQEQMWLVSAGTVFGNTSDMVPGTKRQFNLLLVEREEKNCNITLHSREDSTMQNMQPVWEAGLIGRSHKTVHQFCVELEPIEIKDDESELKAEINRIGREAEKNGDFTLAIDQLLGLDINLPIVRSFLVEYLIKENNPKRIVEILSDSKTVTEAIIYIEACIKTRDANALISFMRKADNGVLNDSSVKSMLTEAKALLKV